MVCITDCACVQGKNPYLPGVSCPPGDSSCTACWLIKGGSTRCNPTPNEKFAYGGTCPYNGQTTGTGHGMTPKPAPHCTQITSGPYTGHCVGDGCGPGNAGSVMSNGLCSRSNPPSGGGGTSANQVEFDLVQTLRSQIGTAFVNQNETCIRDAIHKYSTNFNAMQRVAYQGTEYNNYKVGLLSALKQSYICIPEGGGKAGGSMACTGGQMYGTCTGSNRPALCNVDCNNIGFFDSLVNGLPALCNDANCCRQAQASANCSAYGAGPGPGMMMPGGGGPDCIGLPIGCSTLGLIGAVMIFGLFTLVVLKR